jgi:hypothetical protein
MHLTLRMLADKRLAHFFLQPQSKQWQQDYFPIGHWRVQDHFHRWPALQVWTSVLALCRITGQFRARFPATVYRLTCNQTALVSLAYNNRDEIMDITGLVVFLAIGAAAGQLAGT